MALHDLCLATVVLFSGTLLAALISVTGDYLILRLALCCLPGSAG